MEYVPQPSPEPYSVGERVQVYLGEEDPEAEIHGTVGRITSAGKDDLDSETGRALDAYSYKLTVDGEELNVWFRHFDLVPHE